ncbi:Transcription factor spt20 [Xylographa bjoerkii]|nr:Transcription factor spt20 [Xylographa bjoerkii]
MATAVSARPAPMPQKIKRPPPPMVTTSMNGVKSSHSSPSPSLSSKRPPTGFKHPPNTSTTNGVNSTANGSGPRISNRRRDSQRPSDINRPPRSARLGTGDGGHNDRRASKRMPEPYGRSKSAMSAMGMDIFSDCAHLKVKTTAYMLKKYRKAAPSLILHLHPTHFRFDLQDGSFSYNSPMRMLLEHVKSQTVPHDMLDELKHAGVKFYENCLLVQIQDHRNNSTASQPSSSSAIVDTNVPFSIHNYNEHLTPSPFVPYPHSKSVDRSSNSQPKAGSSTSAADVLPTGIEKESVLPKEEPRDNTAGVSKGPKIFTTVLFSTPLSLQEELLTFANMPDHRANNRKQSQMSARTPASATIPHPPTPSSAVPSTPFPLGPPSKKQKMMFTGKDLAVLEEKLIAATAPPLFLDPVDSPEEVQKLLHKLQDPLSSNDPPAPKSRKRTVAELAADEALAAEEQRFMLIMDERLVPTAATAVVGNAAATDGEAGAASFEPRFERFKAIEEIRHAHQEKAQREAEQKQQLQHQQQAMKQRIEQQQRENQQQNNHLKMQEAARRSQAMRQMQNQQLQQQQMMHQQFLPPGSNSHGHPQTSNAMAQNAFQVAASQGQHSSPIVSNMTPMNISSPLIGDVMVNRGGHAAPMNATSSNQGAGSPPRPGSAAQHAHPSVAASMTGQRNQQPPSRNGTPQMSNGTPRLQQPTPVISNVTPTPRMSHGSPVNPIMAATPVLGQNNMAVPPHGNHTFPMTPQQQQMQHQMAIQRQAQINHQQQLQQGSPPNPQLAMSPQNLQQLAAHHAMQAQQMRAKDDAYRQQLHAMQQHQMGVSQAGAAQMGTNNMALTQQMQMTPNIAQQPGGAQNQYWTNLYKRYGAEAYQSMLVQAQVQYGAQIPQQILVGMQKQAANRARAMIKQKQQSVMMNPQQQQQQQFAMQQAAAQSHQQQAANRVLAQQGFHGMNGMNGMGGME